MIGNVVHIAILKRDSGIKGFSIYEIRLEQAVFIMRCVARIAPIYTTRRVGRCDMHTKTGKERGQFFETNSEPEPSCSRAKNARLTQSIIDKGPLPPFSVQLYKWLLVNLTKFLVFRMKEITR